MPDGGAGAVRISTSTARLDRDLTVVDFDDDWARIISRVAEVPVERIVRGASLPQLAGNRGGEWVERYRDALEGQSGYSRVVLRGEAGGGHAGATAMS